MGCVVVEGSRGVFYGWVGSWVGGHGTGSFRAVGGGGEGGAFGLCPKMRARCARSSSSEVYPVGKLQLHCTCGFDFRHLGPLWQS